ncbi:DEAD/DEAH box helicase [uncultured Methanobrevibacter sp.]|uniref:DEAD/DEAH box helicase n=1 Tax=uncultured Methanobrevibacter sp. TaxID=253161 RepID=UPI0025D507F3|nr:DEAD/DEAH box helicase [uncultured Methanobrevibacter sp.]
MSFDYFDILDDIKDAIEDMGFSEPTPIQILAIPPALEGLDIIAQAQTGSGKTLAFAIPSLNKIWIPDRSPQILVLTPTRELAIQIAGEFVKLSNFMEKLRILPVYGGQAIGKQTRVLKKGVHVVIGTPGRIIDHINRGNLDVSTISTLVLDEADEMLDMGFIEDMEEIISYTPKQRQTMLFSATISDDIKNIAQKYEKNPKFLKTKDNNTNKPKIKEYYFETPRNKKFRALINIFELYDINLALVFCNTKNQVDFLNKKLKNRGFNVSAIHGNMKQVKRDRIMEKFRKSKINILIATDVAARGIDVSNVEIVFNYDLPEIDEVYVHRIGRCGRAGSTGYALSFVTGRDVKYLRSIQRFTKTKITKLKVPTVEDVELKKSKKVIDELKDILNNDDNKDNKINNINKSLIKQLQNEGYKNIEIISALIEIVKMNKKSN